MADKISLERYYRGYGFSENADHQINCVKTATEEGLKWGVAGLAASAATVFGAGKLFPKFDRSLSVSSRTALIVMPFFGLFFLQAELTLNDCGTRKRAMQLAMQQGFLKEQQDGAPANQ